MSLSIQGWHSRYSQQARWTKSLREYLFLKSGLNQSGRLLEVGCGTGVLLEELHANFPGEIHGLDIDIERLRLASRHAPAARLVQGDAHHLPYATGAVDACVCHYLLLWVEAPLKVIAEMARVTRPGGAVLVLAEPDYGGRIDYPPMLEKLGDWQRAALTQQGADPELGRRLAGLLARSGLESVETGVLGGEWTGAPDREDLDLEWSVVEADVETLGLGSEAGETLNLLRKTEQAAWDSGERVLFVPTFYGCGRVPD